MTLAVYQQTIVDEEGDILPSTQVSIRDTLTGAYMPLYTDEEGLNPTTNPFFADDEGFARAYVTPGKYLITMTSGLFSRQLTNVLIGVAYKTIANASARVAVVFSAGSTNHDLAVLDSTKYIDITFAGICTLDGMAAGYDGQEVTISGLTVDDDSNTLRLVPLSGSLGPNQLRMADTLYVGQYMPWTFMYSTTLAKWLLK